MKQNLENEISKIEIIKAELQTQIENLEEHEKKIKFENDTLYGILGVIVESFKDQNPKLDDLTAQQTYVMDRRKLS